MKNETIIEPSVEIKSLQENLVLELSELLPHSHIELIGAMAVPMVGRSEIDIMILSKRVKEDSEILVNKGYNQGPVENAISYLKKMQGDVEIGVQIMSPDNKMINIHRNIISKLQNNEALRKSYEDFKRSLSGLTPEEYKKQKGVWIEKNLLI